jgi:5-methylcytosine-specific restriction endonuclease McrA
MRRRPIPAEVERRVRAAAQNRCGYCLGPQHLVLARLQIEHIIPIAKGGADNEANLWLACPICNGHKSDKIRAPDPVTGDRLPERRFPCSTRARRSGPIISGGPRTACG